MKPDEFIAEVYRRMSLRVDPQSRVISVKQFIDRGAEYSPSEVDFYARILPKNKDCKIVDVGSGNGRFVALCHRLGYQNVTAIDFRAADKFEALCATFPNIHAIDLRGNIGDHFGLGEDVYDVIHMSHVIEHIPKYSLLYAMDAIYKSTAVGGTLVVRTPNMEGPFALSSLFVTLTHEYGFVGSNLTSILNVCGFDDIRLHAPPQLPHGLRQYGGWLLRQPFLIYQRIKARLFGVNFGGQFGGELVATATRGDFIPIFDECFR